MPTVKQFQKDPLNPYLKKVAYVESGNNPNAKNPYGSAGGIFQFTSGSFTAVSDKYKLGYTAEDRFDPKKAEKVMQLFTQDNEKAISGVLDGNITDADRYMAHFLGSGGANKFFGTYKQNPNAAISTVMSPAALAANKAVVYNKDGSLKTVNQVYQWAQKKMDVTPTNVTEDFTDYEVSNPMMFAYNEQLFMFIQGSESTYSLIYPNRGNVNGLWELNKQTGLFEEYITNPIILNPYKNFAFTGADDHSGIAIAMQDGDRLLSLLTLNSGTNTYRIFPAELNIKYKEIVNKWVNDNKI